MKLQNPNPLHYVLLSALIFAISLRLLGGQTTLLIWTICFLGLLILILLEPRK
jgi:hypothetical protein